MYKLKELCDLYYLLDNNDIDVCESIQRLISYLAPTRLYETPEWKDKRSKILKKQCIICKNAENLILQHHFHPDARTEKAINNYLKTIKKLHYPYPSELVRPIKYLSYIKGFINNKLIIPEDYNEIKNLPIKKNKDKTKKCNNCGLTRIRYRKKTNEYVCDRCNLVGNNFFIEHTSYSVDTDKQDKMVKDIVDSYYMNIEYPVDFDKIHILNLINQTILYRSLEIGVFTYCKKCAYIEDKENRLIDGNVYNAKMTRRLISFTNNNDTARQSTNELKEKGYYKFTRIDYDYSSMNFKNLLGNGAYAN